MNYNFQTDFNIDDFKTGQQINTPAKIKLWHMIFHLTFGGMDCAMTQYETHRRTGTWLSYRINGMSSHLDALTNRKYGVADHNLRIVSGTLATQFKKRFPEIYRLMDRNSPLDLLLDTQSNIPSPKPKATTQKQKENFSIKSTIILGELFSEGISAEDAIIVADGLMKFAKENN